MKVKSVVFVFLATCLNPCRGAAWGGATHEAVTHCVIRLVSRDGPTFSGDAEKALITGVRAPDGRGKRGSIPFVYHGFDPSKFDVPGGRPGGGPRMVAHLVYSCLRGPVDDEERAFEMGRALHLLQDFCQPFHTGSGAREARYHARYERWVDRRLAKLMARVADRVEEHGTFERRDGHPGVTELAVATAVRARTQYRRLHLLCRRREEEELEDLTVERLTDAVLVSVYLVKTTNERFSKQGRGCSGGELLWLTILAVGLHVLVRSGSSPPEPGRRP